MNEGGPQEHSQNSVTKTESRKSQNWNSETVCTLYAAAVISLERAVECSQDFFLFQAKREMDLRKQGPFHSLLLKATLCLS